jgi:hypothetical protein
LKQALITSFALLALLGCNTAPVRVVNFEDQPVKRLYNQSVSMDEIQIDIRMAAGKAGWNVIPGELPGHLTAIRINGKTSATVEIIFNLNKYDIKYKDSTSLDYLNGCPDKSSGGQVKVEGKCISQTYNEWVTELNNEISKKLQY